MQRKIFFFILFAIFLTSYCYASCSEDQVLLKLSDQSNSHASVYSTTGYSYNVCYDEIFGETGNGDRTCHDSNTIVNLNSNSNAHAEEPNLNNYAEKICYGDLECQKVTGTCPTDSECVVTLSDNTNAHLALCDSNPYNTKICCKSPSEIILPQACSDCGLIGFGCNYDSCHNLGDCYYDPTWVPFVDDCVDLPDVCDLSPTCQDINEYECANDICGLDCEWDSERNLCVDQGCVGFVTCSDYPIDLCEDDPCNLEEDGCIFVEEECMDISSACELVNDCSDYRDYQVPCLEDEDYCNVGPCMWIPEEGCTDIPTDCNNDDGCNVVGEILCVSGANTPYQCIVGDDGCLDKVTESSCESDFTCQPGIGCISSVVPCSFQSAEISHVDSEVNAGEVININGIISGDCSAVKHVQIDAWDDGEECKLEWDTSSAQIKGIYSDLTVSSTHTSFSASWSAPSTIPEECKGKIIKARVAGLRDANPDTGNGISYLSNPSGSFQFAGGDNPPPEDPDPEDPPDTGECESDADCSSYWKNNPYCSGGNIYDKLVSKICINPSDPASYCQDSTETNQLKQTCPADTYCPEFKGHTPKQVDWTCIVDHCENLFDYSGHCPPCAEYTTLCNDGLCYRDCSAHGGPMLDNDDNICDTYEGCDIKICLGEQASCRDGLICYTDSDVATYPVDHGDALCRDPDSQEDICEFMIDEIQGSCDEFGEIGCWDIYAPANNQCCGNDGSLDIWKDSFDNFCCLGEFHPNTTNSDRSSCICTSLGEGTLGQLDSIGEIQLCDTHGEEYCWNLGTGQCCGDDNEEVWTHSSDIDVDDAIPLASCLDGKWYIRDEADNPTTYDLWMR